MYIAPPVHIWRFEVDQVSYGADKLKMGWIFTLTFDLEGQIQPSPKKATGILITVFYTSGPNLVILAWMGQTWDSRVDTRTHGQTDAGNNNIRRTRRALGKEYKPCN